jgi:cell division protein FtsQ
VQSASVERRLPNQLLISVVERVPFAVWQTGSGYSVIDRNGIAMSGIGLDQLKGLPMITGEGANLAAPSLVDRLQNMPDLLIRMHAAARIGGRRWTIYLDDGLKILLPETDFDAALASLMEIDAKTGLLSKGIVSVDLRQAGRLVVTKADVPEEQDAKLLPAVSKH